MGNTNKKSNDIRKMVYSAIFLAIAMVLPFITGQIPRIGAMLCPMHIPVLLCGFICGWPYGLVVGLIAPILRSLTFGMPQLFPTAVAMTFELAAYGCFAGIIYHILPKKTVYIYISLISSMVLGRIVWGITELVLAKTFDIEFSPAIFINGAIITALPGIILHIIIIPVLVMVFKRAHLMPSGR